MVLAVWRSTCPIFCRRPSGWVCLLLFLWSHGVVRFWRECRRGGVPSCHIISGQVTPTGHHWDVSLGPVSPQTRSHAPHASFAPETRASSFHTSGSRLLLTLLISLFRLFQLPPLGSLAAWLLGSVGHTPTLQFLKTLPYFLILQDAPNS